MLDPLSRLAMFTLALTAGRVPPLQAMDRRGFLRALGVGTVAAAAALAPFDIERALWVPGERTIVIPDATVALAAPPVLLVDAPLIRISATAAFQLATRLGRFQQMSRSEADALIQRTCQIV